MRRSASSFNFGISDHSQSAHYAGGLRPEEILRQHAEIDFLNRGNRKAFRLLKGIESDIRAGSLDYPDDILARFGFVIAQCATVSSDCRPPRKRSASSEPSRTHLQPYSTIRLAACSCDGMDSRSTWNLCSRPAGTPASP